MGNIIASDGEGSVGAKINLIVDLSPEDCFTMCFQLFQRLSSKEREDILSKLKNEETDNS